VVIGIISASALISRLGDGVTLDWPVIAAFTAAAVVGSVVGGRVNDRVAPERLSLAFTVLLLVLAAIMAWQSIPDL
jgi:hypothetical protein